MRACSIYFLLMMMMKSSAFKYHVDFWLSLLLVFYRLWCVVDAKAYTYDDEVIKKAKAIGKSGLVEINAKQDSFIFTVETTGAIKASQLLLNATEILKQKLDVVHLSEDIVKADDQFGELGAHMRGG
ncbi:hypothetical protein S83_017200 [Arachis hypogaea]